MTRGILLIALRDLLIFLSIAALGEVSVRLWVPQASRYVFSSTVTGGHPIAYNSHGLRDVEFPEEPAAGEQRIVCAGDSSTFGAGVAMKETYPKQLERLLKAPAGCRWRVINAGGQGASLSEMTQHLTDPWLRFRPSIVILGFSPTLVSVAGRSGGLEPPSEISAWRILRKHLLQTHALLHSSYLYVLFDAQVRLRLYRLGITRDRMDNPVGAVFSYAFDVPGVHLPEVESRYQALEKELQEFKRLLDRNGIRLVVMGIPSRFRISGEPRDNERGYDLSRIRIDPLQRMLDLCRKFDIPFVDLQARLAQERREMLEGSRPWDDLYIPMDYAHLNPTGMRLAAEELRTALESERRSLPSATTLLPN